MSEPIRVVVVEDQWMIRDGLAALADIADHIDVVATGANGAEAIELAAQHEPNVMLMDIKMPVLDGIEATRRITQSHPGVHVLVLTTFVERDLITRALAAGASGYLTKDIGAEDLTRAITAAAGGIVQLTPAVAARMATGRSGAGEADPAIQAALDGLTARERDVLRLLATGASNPEIAAELHLSTGTVKNHVSAILRQLGTTDRTRAAIIATKYQSD